MSKAKNRVQNSFPPGWDEARVRSVIDYYDKQSEDDEVEEITRMLDEADFRVMRIPVALVPEVEKLLRTSKPTAKSGRRSATKPKRSRAAKAA